MRGLGWLVLQTCGFFLCISISISLATQIRKARPTYQVDRGPIGFVNPFFAGFGSRLQGHFPFGAFAKRNHPHYHIPQMPYPYCQRAGQLLPHPTDRCRYLVCDFGHKPWKDIRGVQLFYAVERSCAPGTAVPRSFLGIVDIYDKKIVSPVWRKAFHGDLICSEITQDCSLHHSRTFGLKRSQVRA